MAEKSKNSSGKSSNDERFAKIHRDPRFNLPKKKAIKGDIDSRFKSALDSDDRFKSTASIDKYGRRVEKKDVKEQLKRYYNLEQEEGSESSSESEGEAATAKLDRMRGEGMSDMSSSEDDSSDEEESEPEIDYDQDEYELNNQNVEQGDASRRLAVVNLDWDNVKSVDLMATFASFVPPNRRINSVKILPSEYGKKRMAEEEIEGPPRDLFDEKEDDVQEANDDGADYSSSRLRKYQLQRLQYYYAIVECDSIEAAKAIYDNCDGTEYESTANFFDIRYVPDEMEFTDKPRDECSKVPANYQPNVFTTDALQHSKVKLTWDETPKERQKFVAKAFSQREVEDMDVKAYLASDSDEGEPEYVTSKYKALLGTEDATGKSDSDVDMEITFNPVLEGKSAKIEVLDKQQPSIDDDENLTTIEKYRLKEKERRKKRMERAKARREAEQDDSEEDSAKKRAELELLMMDDDLSKVQNSTDAEKSKSKKLTKRQVKKKALEEAEENFDIQDPRFQGLFEDPDFAIDSTVPQFKKTKAMEKVLSERRRRQATLGDEPPSKKKKTNGKKDDLSSLVNKLKNKRQ